MQIATIALMMLQVVGTAVSADVSYTMWEDEAENVYIRIHNGTEHTIRVHEISIGFYDAKGKPLEQRTTYCRNDCSLPQQDVRDFELHRKPEKAESYRVRNVRYSIER
jgi:hypothetical protein